MLIINFDKNELCKKAYGLWQYDYGQVLRIQGLSLPTAAEIHFALQETGGEAVTRIGITKDGVTDVTIPDSLLEADGASQDYQIYVFVYLATPVSGETTRRITLGVKSRPRPEAFNTPEGEELFEEAIQAVNNAAKRAEDAGKEATAAAGEARESASLAGKYLTDTQVLAEQVEINADLVAQGTETARDLLAQTQEAASNAALSAETAKQSETAAREAQTAAETAEDAARQYAEETEADRQEVAESKQSVTQMKSDISRMQADVQANREAVEQTVTEFRTAAQGALTAIGQAQNTAVSAVQTEGQRQTTAVQQAGTQAVSDVGTAKTEAIQAVTTEGDTQTKRVQDAAAGIVADREQIAANKAGIEALHQGKADSIVETAQGETMSLTDSSDKLFEGLRVFGKSTQDGTPSVENPVPIVNAGEGGSITVEVTERNLLKPNSYSTYYEFPLKANTVMTLMTNGKPSQGGNIKFSATDGSDVWFSINAGQTRVCRSIGNKDVKGFYDLLSPDDGLEYMFAVGDIKTYTPYVEPQSLTLQTPNGLPGVPVSKDGNYTDENGQQYICDEVDLGREKYVQRVKDFIFNDKTNFSIDTSAKHENSILVDIKIEDASNRSTLSGNPLLCDKLKACREDIFVTDEVSCGYTSGANFLRVRLPISAGTTNEGVKNYLTDKSFKILYILATPIERDLTPEELAAYSSLHAYYPTTVITNDAEAHMEATYVADTGNYVRNMESRLNAKLVNIQSALISQKISGGGIKVTDSSRVPVVRFAMWGKTEQVRTSGKNLFNIKGETTFSKGTFDIKDNLIDCTLEDTWGGSYIMFSKEYPAGEYTFSADKTKNGTVQKMSILLSIEPLSYNVDDCKFNNYYKNYLIKNNKTLSENITFESDLPFKIGIPFGGSEDIVGETLSIKNIQLERGASATAYEPYSGGFPSPSPDWEQPIEITDQPVTVTIKGGAEQQSITLIPPKPMTKWDKLEKVDGVWCWVYQSNHILSYNAESITTEYFSTTGELSAGAEVYYKADVPENIPLPRSEQDKLNALTMYAGTTEVTNTGGCNMELTYTVDTKSYVDSKIAAISAAVLEV